MSKAASKVSSKAAPKVAPKDMTKASAKAVSKGTSKAAPKNSPKDVPKLVSSEIPHAPLDAVLGIDRRYDIYILTLSNGKYYIGKKRPGDTKRYEEHSNPQLLPPSKRTQWTTRNPVLHDANGNMVKHEIPNQSAFDEDRVTREYMYRYGIGNVRGGSYSQAKIWECEYDALKRMLPNRHARGFDASFFERNDLIIVLMKLKQGKYFLGLLDQWSDLAAWLKDHDEPCLDKYPFEGVVGVATGCSWFHLDSYVTAAMMKYGMLNVRGGSFKHDSFVGYATSTGTALNMWNAMCRSIITVDDSCYICGSHDHFSGGCPLREGHNPQQWTRPTW